MRIQIRELLSGHPQWRQLLAVSLLLPLVALLAVVLFAWPAARISPRELPVVGIVGSSATTEATVAALERAHPDAYDFKAYGDESEARRGIEHRETSRHRGRFDLMGALLSTLGMSALVYGFVRAASDGWTDRFTVGSFVAGVVLLAAFARTELRAEKPVTPLSLLFDRGRTGAVVARGLLFAGLFGLFFFLTQFLQDVLHYSPLQTGFAFLPLPLTVLAVSQLTSRVLARTVNGKVLMIVGIILAGAGFLLLSRLTPASPYLTVLVSLLLVAMGNGLSIVPLTSAAIDRVAPADAGAASGLVNVTQQLGGTLGVAILVTVFGSATAGATRLVGVDPGAQAAHVFTVGATHAFLAASLFLLGALALVAVTVRAPKARSAG